MISSAQPSVLAFAALLATLSLAGCGDTGSEPGPDAPRPVHLFEVTSEQHSQLRRFPAVVEATQTAELAFRVGGELEQLPLRPGQNVQAGQLVAALDPTDFEVALEQAEAQAELMRAQFERNQRMLDESLISQAAYDQSRADMRVAQANLRSAQTNFNYTRLKAPFAGVIAHLHVDNYESIAPQQPVMTLQLEGYIDVSIQVPERLFARVRRDLDYQPDVLFDSIPGQFFKASIREWDRIADAATNTYRVVFTLPTTEQINILPGMTATVLIDATHITDRMRDVVVLPASAVFAPENRPLEPGVAYVWVFEPQAQDSALRELGQLSLRQVLIANMTNQGVEIVAGLAPGDRVVQAGTQHLAEGQLVTPWVRERGL